MAARLENALPLWRKFLSVQGGFVPKPRVERRFVSLYPGYGIRFNIYPERVESGYNPFRVDGVIASLPRVGRKRRGQPWALG
jgi:hypothetical protein